MTTSCGNPWRSRENPQSIAFSQCYWNRSMAARSNGQNMAVASDVGGFLRHHRRHGAVAVRPAGTREEIKNRGESQYGGMSRIEGCNRRCICIDAPVRAVLNPNEKLRSRCSCRPHPQRSRRRGTADDGEGAHHRHGQSASRSRASPGSSTMEWHRPRRTSR